MKMWNQRNKDFTSCKAKSLSWNRGVPMASRRGQNFACGFLSHARFAHTACHLFNSGTSTHTLLFWFFRPSWPTLRMRPFPSSSSCWPASSSPTNSTCSSPCPKWRKTCRKRRNATRRDKEDFSFGKISSQVFIKNKTCTDTQLVMFSVVKIRTKPCPWVETVPEWVSWRVGGGKFFLRVFLRCAFCAMWLAIFSTRASRFCTGLFITDPTTRPFYKKWFGLGKREYTKMSLNDIFNGVENEFPGLIPLVEDYLKDLHLDVHSSCTLHRYLRFISKKASGKLFHFTKNGLFTGKNSHF